MTETAVRTEPRSLLLAGRPTTEPRPRPSSSPTTAARSARVCARRRGDGRAGARVGRRRRGEMAALPPCRRAEILIAAAQLVRSREDELARQMTLETGQRRLGDALRGAAHGRDPADRRRGGAAERLDGRARPDRRRAARRGPHRPDAAVPGRAPCSRSRRSTRRCCSSRTSSARRSPPVSRASCGPRRRRRSRRCRWARSCSRRGRRRPRSAWSRADRARRADGARRAGQDGLVHRAAPRSAGACRRSPRRRA